MMKADCCKGKRISIPSGLRHVSVKVRRALHYLFSGFDITHKSPPINIGLIFI
jgi:hypothetical protein